MCLPWHNPARAELKKHSAPHPVLSSELGTMVQPFTGLGQSLPSKGYKMPRVVVWIKSYGIMPDRDTQVLANQNKPWS